MANKVSLTYGHRFARNVTRLSPNAVQTFAFAEFGCTITVTNFIAAGSSTWIRHLRSVTKPSNHGSLFYHNHLRCMTFPQLWLFSPNEQ